MVFRAKNRLTAFLAGAFLTATMAVGLAYAVTGASGSALSSSVSPAVVPPVVNRVAEQSGVSDVETRLATSDGKLGVFVGSDRSGAAMVAFGSPAFSTPFVALQSVMGQSPLEIMSIGGGADDSRSDFSDLVGIASDSVKSVEVETVGGATHDIVPTGNAFAYSAASPEDFPTAVRAYAPSGALVASKDIVPTSPPSG